MPDEFDELYVRTRRALLDASDALSPHLAIVLVGAQAIYLHTGAAELSFAEFTVDADFRWASGRTIAMCDARKYAQLLEKQVGAEEGRLAGRVVRRCDLHHVGTHQIESKTPTDDLDSLDGGEAGDLRGARSGSDRGVESVDVEGQTHRARADLRTDLGHQRRQRTVPAFLGSDHACAGRLDSVEIVGRVSRAAQPDLDDTRRVDETVLDGARSVSPNRARPSAGPTTLPDVARLVDSKAP